MGFSGPELIPVGSFIQADRSLQAALQNTQQILANNQTRSDEEARYASEQKHRLAREQEMDLRYENQQVLATTKYGDQQTRLAQQDAILADKRAKDAATEARENYTLEILAKANTLPHAKRAKFIEDSQKGSGGFILDKTTYNPYTKLFDRPKIAAYGGNYYSKVDPATGIVQKVKAKDPIQAQTLIDNGFKLGSFTTPKGSTGGYTGKKGTNNLNKGYDDIMKDLATNPIDANLFGASIFGKDDTQEAMGWAKYAKAANVPAQVIKDIMYSVRAEDGDQELGVNQLNAYGPKVLSSNGDRIAFGDALNDAKKSGMEIILDPKKGYILSDPLPKKKPILPKNTSKGVTTPGAPNNMHLEGPKPTKPGYLSPAEMDTLNEQLGDAPLEDMSVMFVPVGRPVQTGIKAASKLLGGKTVKQLDKVRGITRGDGFVTKGSTAILSGGSKGSAREQLFKRISNEIGAIASKKDISFSDIKRLRDLQSKYPSMEDAIGKILGKFK